MSNLLSIIPGIMKTEAIINHIVAWLVCYNETATTRGFVVGVSGGIDSAVTSALAARTGNPVLCLEMPIHQASSQESRARKHIDRLENNFPNVSSVRTDLAPVFDQFVQSMPAAEDEETRSLALANSRARLRMTTLYYFAGLHNYLVAGTGNRVEDFGVGFFTKYGDGGVDLSPIADLDKSEVYRLGKTLGIIEDIMAARPTDGLWGDNRSDEDQLGASYDELEWAMSRTFDASGNPDREGPLTGTSARQHQVLKIYTHLHKANRHKMEPVPVCKIPRELR